MGNVLLNQEDTGGVHSISVLKLTKNDVDESSRLSDLQPFPKHVSAHNRFRRRNSQTLAQNPGPICQPTAVPQQVVVWNAVGMVCKLRILDSVGDLQQRVDPKFVSVVGLAVRFAYVLFHLLYHSDAS